MSLFSFLRKNKQQTAADDSTFQSRAEEDSKAVRSRRRSSRGDRGERGEDAVDPVLPEKKRARRRLIGAVALVLAAVIGLPMILDSEPKPLGDDIVIQIPSKEKQSPAAAPEPASPAAALGEQEEIVEPAPPPAPRAEPASPPAVKPAPVKPAPKPEHKAVAPEKPAPAKPAAPLPAKTERKPEVKHAETSEDKARAKALLEGKPDPKAENKAEKKDSGKYVIQVAALATKERVNELQSKLKDAGIKSYTQTVGSGSAERTRIRVGPFASRDEAEKVRAKIVKLGLNGTLVPV
jgi:DedD protein